MGLLKSSIYFYTTLYLLHSSFFVRLGIPFLRPDPHVLRPTRTGPVKVGRRSSLAARSVVSRPRLDRHEHGGRLLAIGWLARAMIRGEPAIGRHQSREPRLYSAEPVWVQTMKQIPCRRDGREVCYRLGLYLPASA